MPRGDHSRMRPDRLAKLGLDAWARPLPSPGTMVLVDVPGGLSGTGLYVDHLPSGHDRRVRHGHILIRGGLVAMDLNYIDPLPAE